jgi:membrane protein required for colicin V production
VISWSHLAAVDWVILVVLSLSITLSLWRGFVREAISLAGWIAAFFVANMYVDEMATLLGNWIVNITGRYVIGYAVLFAGALVLAGILGRLGRQLVKVTGLSLLDRLLGTVFGLARGVIIILVAVYLLRQLAPPQELQWLHQSQLMPHVDMLVRWVQMLFHDLSQPGFDV